MHTAEDSMETLPNLGILGVVGLRHLESVYYKKDCTVGSILASFNWHLYYAYNCRGREECILSIFFNLAPSKILTTVPNSPTQKISMMGLYKTFEITQMLSIGQVILDLQ